MARTANRASICSLVMGHVVADLSYDYLFIDLTENETLVYALQEAICKDDDKLIAVTALKWVRKNAPQHRLFRISPTHEEAYIRAEDFFKWIDMEVMKCE